MTIDTQRDLIRKPEWSPIWLRGPLGIRYLYTYGFTHDHLIQYAKEGVRMRFPRYAEDQAIAELCNDRGIKRYPGEPITSIRERLRRWLTSHRLAGTANGIFQQLAPFWSSFGLLTPTPAEVAAGVGAPFMRLVAGNSIVAHWASMDTLGKLTFARRDVSNGGSNWDWDSQQPAPAPPEPTAIHRYHLILYAPPSVTPSGLVESPSTTRTVGSTLSIVSGQTAGDIAKDWQREGSVRWSTILAFDRDSFDPLGGPGPGYPDGRWYRDIDPSTGTFTRLQTARYMGETRWFPGGNDDIEES